MVLPREPERLTGSVRLMQVSVDVSLMPARQCRVCGGALSRYNHTHTCWHHESGADELEDAELDTIILTMLREASPRCMNVCRTGIAENARVKASLVRLRARGHAIRGVPGHGHVLVEERRDCEQ